MARKKQTKQVSNTKHFFEYYNKTIVENWDRPAMTDYTGTNSYTYGKMATQMARLQNLLETAGITRGDKVVLCGVNSSNWAISFLSVAANRGVVVSIMDAFVGADIEKLTNHSDAKAMFVGDVVWSKIDINNMPNVELVIGLADFDLLYAKDKKAKDAYVNWDENFAARYPNGYRKEDVALPTDNIDELMIINYTSGTTSDPKGVMVSYRSISSNVQFAQEEIPSNPGETEVCMLPLAHMFGLTIEFIYQVAGGIHVYFLGKTPSPSVLMRAFAEAKPYMIITVPMVLEKIIKGKVMPALQKPLVKFLWNTPILSRIVEKKVYNQLMAAFGGNLRFLITGGAAINPEVEKVFRKIKFPFTVGYGMTECGPLISYVHYSKQPNGSCGVCVTRNELKIDSKDPQHEVGEILFRGEHVMMGYYKNEEATNAALDKDGWLHTGDLGTIDKDGNLFIKGRSKAMLLSSNGQNIYPEEVEGVINNIPGVVESVLVSREGKLVALIFPDYSLEGKEVLGGQTLEAYIRAGLPAANAQLPNYSKVLDIELVKEEFEKTPKRSIRRFLYH